MGSSGVPIPPKYGGAIERHIYDVARFLASKNAEVHVLTLRTANEPRQQRTENVWVHRGGFFSEDPSTESALLKHLTFSWYVFLKLLFMRVDIIHAHNGLPGLAAILASKIKRVPFIFTSHTSYERVGHQIFREEKGLKSAFDDLQVVFEKLCARKAFFTIAVSKKVRKGLISLGVSSGRIFVIPNGVDMQRFKQDPEAAAHARRKYGLLSRRVVLYVGRIIRYKGLDYLVVSAPEIVKRHSNVKFVVAGPAAFYQTALSTPYYEELREEIERQKLQQFFLFTGAVNEKDLLGLYSACDLFVLPSLVEPFGMVLVEAMSCGKPVIGSRIDGIIDIINDGKDGFLISPAAPKELAAKIDYLLARPKEIERMGEMAIKHVKTSFDWSKLALRVMEIYSEAIR